MSNMSASEGRPEMSDVIPLSGISGLSFDSSFLSLPSFFGLVLLLFLSVYFSNGSFSFFSPENSQIFFVKI